MGLSSAPFDAEDLRDINNPCVRVSSLRPLPPDLTRGVDLEDWPESSDSGVMVIDSMVGAVQAEVHDTVRVPFEDMHPENDIDKELPTRRDNPIPTRPPEEDDRSDTLPPTGDVWCW